MRKCPFHWLAVAIALPTAFSANATIAQITPDNTLPSNSRVNIQQNIQTITGGTRSGTNLFHSFKEFSVPTGSQAYFNNTADIHNILTRVTGKSISNIDGLIRANGTANLFLINPNGIVFGQNAKLEIGGSFFATSANSMKFTDGFEFSATNPETAPLLTISVPVGLQYGSNAGNIQVQGSSLQVSPGQTLALVGGLNMDGGKLLAPGGRVFLLGVGEGTVGLSENGNDWHLISEGVPRTDVSLTNGAEVNVLAFDGGSIAVNAMNLNMAGGSSLKAGINYGNNSVGAVAGDIDVNATGTVNLSDTSIISNQLQANAAGKVGDIRITTGSLRATGGSQIRTYTYGQGDTGSVTINASDTVTFDGKNSTGRPSAARSLITPGGVGKSGGVTINTGSLFVTNGAELNTSILNQGRGTGGGITVNARNQVSFDGGFAFSRLEKGAVGQSGDIRINTGSLLLTGLPESGPDSDIGQVVAALDAEGNAASVIINARDAVPPVVFVQRYLESCSRRSRSGQCR